MPSTTNFGWTTPADTDLVKDGASAIRTLGNGIDTSFVDLKGGTTGQALTKNSNTDLDFVWTSISGDISEVNAGVGISGGGTSGAVTITNSMATAIDAKGDLIAGTGADTFSRLAIGTNNQVLVADSTASTGMKWADPAGAYVELASGSLTGTSVSISSISQNYQQLVLICSDYYPSADDTFAVRVNSTSSIYAVSYARDSGAVNDTKMPFFLAENMDAAQNDAQAVMFFDDYANTTSFKTTRQSAFQRKADNTNYLYGWIGGFIRTTSAISSIQIEYVSGSSHAGGTYKLFGVK